MQLFGLLLTTVLAVIVVIALWSLVKRVLLQTKWHLFVSHKSEEKNIVLPIVTKLTNRNIQVWYDDFEINTQSGDRFRPLISVGIQHSSYVLLFTSKEFCASDYCKQEALFFLKRFEQQPDRIIEIRLDQNEAHSLLNIPLQSICIDFCHFDLNVPIEEQYNEPFRENLFNGLVENIILLTNKEVNGVSSR